MADIVSPAVRSRMMAGIRGKDTRPELLIRKGLFARGLRYRLHDRKLPGKPDLVLPRHKAVIMAHGCFWHAHDCPLFKWPSSNVRFWRKKISRNKEVDRRNHAALERAEWRVLTIWECALKGTHKRPTDEVMDKAARWVVSGAASREIRGKLPKRRGKVR